MQTVEEFAAKAATTGEALSRAQRQLISRAALTITKAVREEVRSATGDSRLSGVGKRGTRVGAKYTVLSAGDALIQATGPLHLVERATRAHDIAPKRRRSRRNSRRPAALYLGGTTHYARVSVRGTSARRPFAKGVARSKEKATREYQEDMTRVAWRHLGAVS